MTVDGLFVGDGLIDVVNGVPADLSGTNFLANGSPVSNGTIGVQFIDTTASLYNSTLLPTSLDLADFDLVDGIISSFDDAGFVSQISFSVDTLEASSVPEPSCLVLLMLAAAGYTTFPGRKKRFRQ